jgi:para-nitrobenzyl esterase
MKLTPFRCVLLLLMVFVSSCGSGGVSTGSSGNALTLSFGTSPIELSGIAASFASDVAYGAAGLNTFDIFLPNASQPTGLIIYVHGGGFTGGDKSSIYQNNMADDIRDSLSQGVAFASINYRLLEAVDSEGVIKPLGDSRRALQFLRYHANTLNIDPSRIAMYGESAGAGASLWLAYHDDMADTSNTDPVLRQSTRIVAVGAIETQASYDITRWETDVFVDYGITIDGVQAISPLLGQRLMSFYGVTRIEQLDSDAIVAYRADVDMLGLMSADDPDTWLRNSEQALGIPLSAELLFHHAYHAREIREQAITIGLTNVSYIPQLNVMDPSGENVIPFLIRHIQ